MAILLFTISACSHQPTVRTPASYGVEISCLKLHQTILRRVNDNFELVEFNGLSDMPKNIVEVAESFDQQGIDYQFIRRLEDNLLGIEILPNEHGYINRYVKNINQRFDGVRVFYLDTAESNVLGSFSPLKNYIFLGKGVSSNLSTSGYTTLSHEARHAYFTARILRYMNGSYKGKISATKGTIKGSGNFSYTTYMSFQEVKTFKEDARKFFGLWLDKLSKEKKHNKAYWDKFVYKTNATLSYLQSTRYYLDEMMNAIIDDSIVFETQMGVMHASKEIVQDSDNSAIVRLALNQNSSIRQELKQEAIEQINKELDQLFIDETTLSSQRALYSEIAKMSNREQLTFFSLFTKRYSLANARDLRASRLQEIINQYSNTIFSQVTNGKQIQSDSEAIEVFAKIVKDSTINELENSYSLSYQLGKVEIKIDRDGFIQDLIVNN